MSDEADLRNALHAQPGDDACWLALGDALEETGQSERAEITRLLTWLRRTLDHADRPAREERLRSLLASGVRPCVPEVVNSLGMRLALIPPGVFMMGRAPQETPNYSDEEPRREVAISRPFYLGVFAVTQSQYRQVAGCNPSHFEPGNPDLTVLAEAATDSFPVDQVSWDEAVDFCKALSRLPAEREGRRKYRLPTEAEWEYACRAGTTTPFHFGTLPSAAWANFDGTDTEGTAADRAFLGRTTTVGSYVPNAFGLWDMHGNVNEWCSDWYSEGYPSGSPVRNPKGIEDGGEKVVRGGCWNFWGRNCRSAYRNASRRDSKRRFDGFRVVCMGPGRG
jgi:uncharacterized protein (TIGR02996 family)